eukprot:jgi/Psemu1/263041/estExt_Genewise1Plus.C_9080027
MPRRSARERKGRGNKRFSASQSDSSEDEYASGKGDSELQYEDNGIKPNPDHEADLDHEQGKRKPRAASEPIPDCEESDRVKQEDSDPQAKEPLWKRKKRKKKVFKIDEEEEAKPTYTRKTEKGGYAHTNLSKSRISEANKGNKPWNFGRRRSSADKAKIAAGVRARNRTILLQKLKHLGMTEEEYLIKKKEIKYLRERVRRAKVANGKHHDKKIEQKLQEAIDATNLKNIVLGDEETKSKKKKAKKPKNADDADKETDADEEQNDENSENDESGKPQGDTKDERSTGIFSKEIIWRPFSFSEENATYDQSCPEGGPGGLICCERCSTKYNLLLTRTSEDVESYRMNKEAGEVTEILDFLNEKKQILKDAVNSAKTKIPPLPPPGSGRLSLRQESQPGYRSSGGNRRNFGKDNIDVHSSAWNLTSSIDLGFTGGFASV